MAVELHVLVVDDERKALGPLAIRLVRAGVDVLYTPFSDEARLLMRQEGARVRALVVTPEMPPAEAARLFEEATAPDGSGARAMLVVGRKPTPDTRASLRAAGAEWCVLEPFDDGELRFVLNTAVALPEELAPRREPRAAHGGFAWIRLGGTRSFGVFYSISACGAFIETPSPLPKGVRLALEFELEERRYTTAARVIYRNAVDEVAVRNLPWGMGVRFEGLAPDDEAALRAWCEQRARRYRL